ncbi:MAG: serine hydrolase domain-containing protein [Steroidobacter sp.]
MQTYRLKFSLFAALLLTVFAVAADDTRSIATAQPEAVGFSSERLQRLDKAMQATVDNKQLAGAVTVLARHGKVVSFNTYGQQDLAGAKPMQKDSIFRIFSMTKPVTGVAMMVLYEEGKWRPNEPIAKYIPEFKDLKVYAGQDQEGKPILEAPKHAPTIGELMTHTAGFTYGLFGASPVDKMYAQSKPLESASLKEFIDKLSKLPLAYQPGEGWEYSVSVDVQGYLVERLSGMPFPQFIEERVFKPLGMTDTAFFVPENKLSRLATIYVPNAKSALAPMPRDANVSKAPGMPSGGGGLYSTAHDYLQFAQMLLNEGDLNGVQILSPSTVRLMRSNHLPERLMTGKHGIGFYRMQPGLGFGYDVAVFEDPIKVGSTAGQGSYLWDGVAGTWFWIDPTNDVLFIGLIQRWMMAPGMPNLEDLSRALVYQALVEPEK